MISITNQQIFSYFMPTLTFLLVFIIIYALLSKTKALGSNPFIHLLISFIAAVFVISSPFLGEFTRLTATWFAVFIISIVFILAALAFTGKDLESVVKNPVLSYVLLAVIIIIFVFSTIKVFGSVIQPYLPGQSDAGGSSDLLEVKHFLFNPAVAGAIILFIVGAFVASILTKGK